MDDLISRKALLKSIKNSTAVREVKFLAEVLVRTEPTVDAVTVTYCRHCKHAIKQFLVEGVNGIACYKPNEPIWHCKYWDTEVSHNYFCGSGVPRDTASDQ